MSNVYSAGPIPIAFNTLPTSEKATGGGGIRGQAGFNLLEAGPRAKTDH